MRLKPFSIGVIVGLLVFIVANLVTYHRMLNEPVLTDATVGFGFPFQLYVSGGFTGEFIVWSGLVFDVLIAVGSSLILGFVVKRLLKARQAFL